MILNRNYGDRRNMAAQGVARVMPVVPPEVALVDISDTEACLLGIKDVRKKLIASREVGDQELHIKFTVGEERNLFLHTQRDDLFCKTFHINNGRTWSLEGGDLEQGFLGLGFGYLQLTQEPSGVEMVEVGFPKFEESVYAVLNSFTADGNGVSGAYRESWNHWRKSLSHGLASLFVMTIEPCRSNWFNENLGRLIREHQFSRRNVWWEEGKVINSWEHTSRKSEEQKEINGSTWRNTPFDRDDDLAKREDPIYARTDTAVRHRS